VSERLAWSNKMQWFGDLPGRNETESYVMELGVLPERRIRERIELLEENPGRGVEVGSWRNTNPQVEGRDGERPHLACTRIAGSLHTPRRRLTITPGSRL
jgi:hypothetical protein